MARQQQNRVNPDTVESFQLRPSAAPVNKLSQYQVDMSDINKTKATAQGLAALAKGISDINPMIKDMSEKAVRAAYEKAKAENKKEWADVSKNISGMGKFNPYNKETFDRLTAQDITRNYIQKLYSAPEMAMRTPQEFDSLLKSQQQQLMKDYESVGLTPRSYVDYLETYSQKANQVKNEHVKSNAEFTYRMTNNKIQQSYGGQLVTVPTGTDKAVHFNNVLNGVVAEGQALGRTAYANAENILGTVRNAIYTDPSQYNSAYVLGQLRGYTIDGKTLQELIPDFDAQVLKMVREAKQADLQDRKLEYESTQFDMQLRREQAADEWLNFLVSGGKLNPEEQRNMCIQIAQKYQLDGKNTFKLLDDFATGRKTFVDFEDTPSDPNVAFQLQQGIFTGETTSLAIAEAMGEGKLSRSDAQVIGNQLYQFQNQKQTKDIKRVNEHVKRAVEEYTKDNSTTKQRAILRSPQDRSDFTTRVHNLRGQYEQGEIDYTTFNNELSALKAASKVIQDRRTKGQAVGFATGYEVLKSTPTISKEQWDRVDVGRSTLAIRRMGIIKNNAGGNSNTVYIDSAPQSHRPYSGTRHTGYDLGGKDVKGGKAVHCPVSGEVVGVLVGDNGGMGNMVLIRANNGKLIKFMHLQNAGLPSLGDIIDKDTPIGYVGTTGRVGTITNKDGTKTKVPSLHFECYDKNMQWITAWEFVQ